MLTVLTVFWICFLHHEQKILPLNIVWMLKISKSKSVFKKSILSILGPYHLKRYIRIVCFFGSGQPQHWAYFDFISASIFKPKYNTSASAQAQHFRRMSSIIIISEKYIYYTYFKFRFVSLRHWERRKKRTPSKTHNSEISISFPFLRMQH